MPEKEWDSTVQRLVQGVRRFQTEVFSERRSLFQDLAKGQKPDILFITCSDSRIDPNLITQSDPGDMFVIQNAGNIVPPHGAAHGGVGASIEYAVSILKVGHIVICGHSGCGAMGALLQPQSLGDSPTVKHWLSLAEATRAIVDAEHPDLTDVERWNACIDRNIAVQLDHLRTLPAVAVRLAAGQLSFHGWVFDIATGGIRVYDENSRAFRPFVDHYGVARAAGGKAKAERTPG